MSSARWCGTSSSIVDRAALGELHAGCLEAVALDARREADRLQHLVGLEDLCSPPSAGETVTLTLSPESSIDSTLVVEQHLHAELLVVLGQLLGDLGVLQRHHPVEELHDRHVDAEVLHHVGELDADRARAGDDDRRRAARRRGSAPRRSPPARTATVPGSSRVVAPVAMMQVVEGELLGARRPSSFTSSVLASVKRAPAVDLGDLVLLHQEVHALDDARRTPCGCGRASAPKSIDASPVMPNLSFSWVRMCASSALRSSALEGMQPTLRQTPPQYLLLDDGDALAELGGADGGDVPTGAGTEDDDVEVRAHAPEPRGCRDRPRGRCRTSRRGRPPGRGTPPGALRPGRARRLRRRSAPGSSGPPPGRRRAAPRRRPRRPRAPARRPGPAAARAPGTASRRRCGGGPRPGTAGRPRRSPGGAAEANAATVGSRCLAPHSRASRATAWLASWSEEPAAASTSASSSRTRASLSAARSRRSRTSRNTGSRPSTWVARIRGSRVPGGGLGDGGGHVDLGVVGLGQQQRYDDDLVVPRLDEPVDDRARRTAWRARGTPARRAGPGACARTSSTSALIVWAERGSRLPWARATRAGAVMGGASCFVTLSGPDDAVGGASVG